MFTRGHSDINTTPSVIMSLFCCRSLCLCIFLSRCLFLFILALSRSACLRSSLKSSLFGLTLSRSACRRSSLKFSPCVLTLSRSVCRCSSLKSSLFVLACLFLLADFLRENFCLLLLLLTGSLWRSSSLAPRLLTLPLCRSLSLCSPLKPVV